MSVEVKDTTVYLLQGVKEEHCFISAVYANNEATKALADVGE